MDDRANQEETQLTFSFATKGQMVLFRNEAFNLSKGRVSAMYTYDGSTWTVYLSGWTPYDMALQMTVDILCSVAEKYGGVYDGLD